MKCYLAAQFARQAEMRHYRNDLEEIGWSVTSSWLDSEGALFSFGSDANAQEDRFDIDGCDALILFSGPPYYGTFEEAVRGSRHVEFGYAWGIGKLVFVIGPYENLFQKMPHVHHFDSWEQFLSYIRI